MCIIQRNQNCFRDLVSGIIATLIYNSTFKEVVMIDLKKICFTFVIAIHPPMSSFY